MDYQLKNVQNHIEVYDAKGQFLFSADTMHEALDELAQNSEAA